MLISFRFLKFSIWVSVKLTCLSCIFSSSSILKKPKKPKEQIIENRKFGNESELYFVIKFFRISGVKGSLGAFGFLEHNLTARSK